MNGDIARVHPLKRLAYAFVALLAGDAVLFVVMLQFAIRERADLLAAHMGEPARIIPLTLQWFAINAGFSLAGWALIAVPVVLVPDRSIARLSWLSAIAVGALLGPTALFLVFALLGHRHFSFSGTFRGLGWAWIFSGLVSTVSFAVYAALLRRGQGR